MAWLPRILALFRKQQLAKDLDEELAFHLSMREQWNRDRGMSAAEARQDARRRFGNPSVWRERMSEIDLLVLLQSILQDVHYGMRMLYRNPAFTLVVVFTLAIGIGANTTAFTAYTAFFGRALDARSPEKVVNIALTIDSTATSPTFSYPDYEAYRDQLHSFSGIIAAKYGIDRMPVSVPESTATHHGAENNYLFSRLLSLPSTVSQTESAMVFTVSENYFSVLGIGALRGRTFQPDDIQKLAASPAVLISENYWQKRFDRDPAILGKTIKINGSAFNIIGITPHDFVGTTVMVPDFWLPLSLDRLVHPDVDLLHNREELCCRLFARLAPGISMVQAQAEMNLLADRLRSAHASDSDRRKPTRILITTGSPFPRKLDDNLRFAILLIMLSVGMVLVIACANVASLQLARSASRQNEFRMRHSLGASRFRLVRQLLTESILLGIFAGVVGLLCSWVFLRLLVMVAAEAFPPEFGTFILHVTPNLGVFLYVFAISLIAGILLGLAPALESSRSALRSAFKAGSSGFAGIRNRRVRNFLLVTQVAVSLVLMIAGTLLIRSSIHVLTMDTGYDSKHVIQLELGFPNDPKFTSQRKAAIVQELRIRLAEIPTVSSIVNSRAPDGGGVRSAAIATNGKDVSSQNTQAELFYTYTEPNYFSTLGIPLLLGRSFMDRDNPEASVILSESAAKRLWPGENPLGKILHMSTKGRFFEKGEMIPDGPAYQVVGIARDIRGTLLDGSDVEQIYLPLPKVRLQDYPLLLRTAADPNPLRDTIASAVSAVDPDLVVSFATLDDLLRQTPAFIAAGLAASIASCVGLLGFLLACTGIYSTVSYLVVLRTQEVGIRMALGATRSRILGLILKDSSKPVLIGLGLGFLLSLEVSNLLHGILYGLHRLDGISFLGVSTLFFTLSLCAAYIPSRRAMKVDPMVALRYE